MKFRYSENDGLEIQDEHWSYDLWTRLPLNPTGGWTVVTAEPLTVMPSILNQPCGCHGFITNGEWVPV